MECFYSDDNDPMFDAKSLLPVNTLLHDLSLLVNTPFPDMDPMLPPKALVEGVRY